MKSKLFLSSLLIALGFMFTMSSCNPDDPIVDNPTLAEDGVYVAGTGTALSEYVTNGLMKSTRNEVNQADRAELLETYIAVEAGKGFNIVVVEGGQPKVYGPGDDFATVEEADKIGDEPRGWFARGSVKETTTEFTVTESGLYHVVYDTELGIAVVAKADWGIVGAATPGGWSGSTALPSTGFDKEKITFELTNVIMLAADWKFRYSDGWKIVLDETYDLGEGVTGVRVNTNFGGSIDALVPGGDNIVNSEAGVYTVDLVWELGQGFSATLTKTGDYTPPSFPDAMYIVGDATAYGWDSPSTYENALMHKCADASQNDGIFWKIAYLEAGKGFKLSEANWGTVNLGFADVDEYDANGVAVTDNGGNMSIAESGMYMIVVNLQNDMAKVSVVAPSVYGIGDAFGSWDEDVADYKFTVDNTNKNLVSPALAADGNIRMYASHAWIAAWWNAEFNVFNGVIEYRNDGGDQEAVAGTAGQVITLHFDDNTGSIQ